MGVDHTAWLGPSAAFDSSGIAYVEGMSTAGTPEISAITPDGTPLWTYPTDGYVTVYTSPVIGANGSVFFQLWNGAGYKLLGLSMATGAVTLDDSSIGFFTNLRAYGRGLIILEGGPAVDYLNYDGSLRARYTSASLLHSFRDFTFTQIGETGTLFLAGYNEDCANNVRTLSILKIDPGGVNWAWTDNHQTLCTYNGTFAATSLASTPAGGVVIGGYTLNQGGQLQATYEALTPNGTFSSAYTAQLPSGSTPGPNGTGQPLVDVNGIVAMATPYIEPCPVDTTYTCAGVQVDLAPSTNLAATSRTIQLLDQNTQAGSTMLYLRYWILDQGRIYGVRASDGVHLSSMSALNVTQISDQFSPAPTEP
jgi:hypothetical protein